MRWTTQYSDAGRRRRLCRDAPHLVKKGKTPDLDVSEARPSDCDLWTSVAGRRGGQTAGVHRPPDGAGRQGPPSAAVAALLQPARRRAQRAERLLADYLQRRQPAADKTYYYVEDVCGRMSGIGSMGRMRYVLLISGKGSEEGRNVLLEFKESRPSAYDLYRQRDPTRRRAGAGRARDRRAETVAGREQRPSRFRGGRRHRFSPRDRPGGRPRRYPRAEVAGAPGRGGVRAGADPRAHPRPLRPSPSARPIHWPSLRTPTPSASACLLRPRLCGRRAPRLVALRRRPRRPRRRCRLVRVVGMMNDELLDSSFITFSPARRRGGRSRA